MTDLLQEADNAEGNSNFARKVRMALLHQVGTIATEDPGTTNHTARMALAARVVHQLDLWSGLSTAFLATQGLTIDTDDDVVLTTMGALIDPFSLLAAELPPLA